VRYSSMHGCSAWGAAGMKGREMDAKEKALRAKVKELGGWFDGEMIRFPSVYIKDQFVAWCNSNKSELPSMSYPSE